MDKELFEFIRNNVQKYYHDSALKIFLFGSRARGDHSDRSDWDFALETESEIAEFMLEIKEESPTLCGVDIIFLNSATSELKEQIKKEGKLIYEQ